VGGWGSGGWYRFGKKDAAEDLLSIDVRAWRREGLLRPGVSFTTTWSHYRDESSIGVRVLGYPVAGGGNTDYTRAVELSYSWGPKGRKEDVCYRVALSWSACNFGGSRPWFICPGVVNGVHCARRVALLYLSQRLFLCRHCHGLTYASRRESKGHAALRTCQRIRQKLGGSANMTKPFPKKPRGMHWRTYARLYLQHERAEQEYTRSMMADLEKMNVRFPNLLRKGR